MLGLEFAGIIACSTTMAMRRSSSAARTCGKKAAAAMTVATIITRSVHVSLRRPPVVHHLSMNSFSTSAVAADGGLHLPKQQQVPERGHAGRQLELLGMQYAADEQCNLSESVVARLGRRLHRVPNHPLNIIKSRIENYFLSTYPNYAIIDDLHPVVTTAQNFDDLLISKDHPSRSPSDTYYVNSAHVLRTHTSAHQSQVLRGRTHDGYLITADVYRRDEIDPSHYPIFHQMEGLRLFSRTSLAQDVASDAIPTARASWAEDTTGDSSPTNPIQNAHFSPYKARLVSDHMKRAMEGMVWHLLAGSDKNLQVRWIEGYFPFTGPSWELEVLYMGKWLELCGCGVVQQPILEATGNGDKVGWAFGFGLERLAMVMFGIPDIRLFWSEDPRFLSQFSAGEIVKFKPYSKYPACYKDISFWLPGGDKPFHDNDMFELVRDVAGDNAETVTLIDEFTHPKSKRVSKCYRISYRSMDRTLTNEEVDEIQEKLRTGAECRLSVELRG